MYLTEHDIEKKDFYKYLKPLGKPLLLQHEYASTN